MNGRVPTSAKWQTTQKLIYYKKNKCQSHPQFGHIWWEAILALLSRKPIICPLLSPMSLGWDNTFNHLIFSSHKKVMPEFECPRNLIMFAPYSSHQWSLTGEEWQPKWAWILQRSCQVSLAASSSSFSRIQLLFESCPPKASIKTKWKDSS